MPSWAPILFDQEHDQGDGWNACGWTLAAVIITVRHVLAAFLTTILYSISVVCGHRSAKLLGGSEANFWRLVCATVLLGIWSFTFGIGLSGAAFPLFLISGVLGIGVGDVALFQALPRLGSRLTMLLLQCLSAPLGAVIEWFWLGNGLSLAQIGCGVAIVLGVALALAPGEHLRITRRELWVGSLFAVLGAVGNASGAVLSRKAYSVAEAAGERIDGANAAFQRIIGGLVIGGICLLLVKWHQAGWRLVSPALASVEQSRNKRRRAWPWVMANSLAGQTLGVSCMQWALKTTPTGIVLAITATTPIVVIPFAMVFEGERPNRRSVIGGAIAVSGVIALALSRSAAR